MLNPLGDVDDWFFLREIAQKNSVIDDRLHFDRIADFGTDDE
jgi:hypothetical protein